jgi:hypothetical protein
MVDVIPLSNGACSTQTLQGHGSQAGVNVRGSYPGDCEAVYTATLNIATCG